MKLLLTLLYGLLLLLPGSSEQAQADTIVNSRESIIPLNTNLELYSDSIMLEFHPVKDAYVMLYEGDCVAVAEYAPDPADSTIVWIKLAHSEEKQGWITEKALIDNFVPTDSISQFIYYFSHRQVGYFIVIISVFILICLCRFIMRKQIPFVYFNDIDSLYPLFLCLLVSLNAILYQYTQMFAHEVWQQYYFSPTLSPLHQHPLIAGMLTVFWLSIIIIMAVIDVVFKQLRPGSALIYMTGLFCACIFFYIFFIFAVKLFVGYFIFALFAGYFLYRVIREFIFRFRCGSCGKKMKKRGVCSNCGVRNQ